MILNVTDTKAGTALKHIRPTNFEHIYRNNTPPVIKAEEGNRGNNASIQSARIKPDSEE